MSGPLKPGNNFKGAQPLATPWLYDPDVLTVNIGHWYRSADRCLVLVKNLIIFAHRNTEDDRSDVFEAVDPLFALRPLTSNVEQSTARS